MLWSARKLYGWPRLPTSSGIAACNRIFPARFAISGCSHLRASWRKSSNFLGKQGHDLFLVFVRLTSEGLNDPQSVAQIEFLKVVLVLVGLAILLQLLPALLGVPSEHFEPFTEGHCSLGSK